MNNKKLFYILIFISLFGQLMAQTNFYLRPTIDYKYNISSTSNYGIRASGGFSDKFAGNPYFEIDNKVFSKTTAIQMGCTFGVNLNKKKLIEIGWTLDGAGSQIATNGLSLTNFQNPNTVNYYSAYNGNAFSYSLITHRFQLQYYGIISKISTKNIKNYFNGGLGLVFNPSAANPKKNSPAFIENFGGFVDSSSFGSSDSTFFLITREEHTTLPTNRFGFCINLGISTDFYNDKEKYLFSVTIFYLKGFKNLLVINNLFNVLDDGVNKLYSYNTYSNGSGIHFQLSRRFQFKTWKDKLKKNELGLPKL
jgi:hypothetical protein